MSNSVSRTRIERAQNANRERGERSKESIFSLIAQSEPEGMTTDQITRTMGLRRKRIHAICKEYIDKEELRKTGKFGTYHLGAKSQANPGIAGFLFHLGVMKQFSDFEYLPVSKKIFDPSYRKWIISTMTENKETKMFLDDTALDELELSEFVIRVGVIVTYAMIKGMEYRAHPDIEQKLSSTSREQLIWKWIQNAITLQSLLHAFTELGPIYRRLKSNKATNESEYSGHLYEMDQRDIDTLKEAFKNIFPDAYNKLENIASNIPQQLESRREQLKRFSNTRRDPNHTKCDGELFPEVVTDIIIKEGKKAKLIKLKKCSKCGRSLIANEIMKETR